MKGVKYPDVELEMPDFIVRADEILEAEIQAEIRAELERIRILNRTPVPYMNPRMITRRQRAARRKQVRDQHNYNLPEWLVNPLGLQEEVDYEAVQEEKEAHEGQQKMAEDAERKAIEIALIHT